MTAVITAPTDLTTDPLAAAASASAPGRATAGDFDLLIALLQGALAGPVSAPGAAPEAAAETAVAEASASVLAPGTARRVSLIPSPAARLSIGTGGEPLDPLGEDDARETPASSVSLLLTLTPPQGPVLAVVNGGPAGEETAERLDARPAAPVPTVTVRDPADAATAPQNVEIVANDPAGLADAMAAAKTSVPSEPEAMPAEIEQAVAPMAAPAERPRPFPGRGVDPLRAGHASGGQEISAGNGMTRTVPDAASSTARLVPGGDDLPRANPLPSRDGDAAGTSSAAGSVSGVSAAAPRAEGMTFENADRTRSESPRSDAIDQVVTRLRELRTPGRHEISVRLDPPELGGVRIDARLEGSRLHVQIRAEHAPTSEMLTDALPRIRETLAQQGFAPGDVSVHLGFDGSGRHSARDSAPTFTPPRDNEPSRQPRTVPAIARALAAVDGLDVWA